MSWSEKLSTSHRRMLLSESAISARTLISRDYRTVRSKAELQRLGFGASQRNVPALLIPIYGPDGEIALYQARPESPRIKGGKPVKYETPSGAAMKLDVHPRLRRKLADPEIPLFVTEGVKKGDALASRDLAAVALIGVWNWRGTNEAGGKTALPEWESIALNGRKVYVVFDSDVMEKREVYGALVRLKTLLESRGAKVRLIYLPPTGEGSKQGVDDFLATGYTVEDLLGNATSELREPPAADEEPRSPYRATSGGLVWDKPVQDGVVPTPLTNFTAKIAADVAEDDGAEVRRSFEIEAELNGARHTFTIPSAQFAPMSWPTEHLGAGAIVYPGFGLRDHARAAVQLLSGGISTRHVYAHTGWRELEAGEWAYLHAGGAVGRVGQLESTQVELTGSLAERALPDAGDADEDLVDDVRTSLELWNLAPAHITVPLLAATYRAALGESDFSVHLSGASGEGKSELAALCQQHYGASLDSRRLASWESTENAIEGQAFQAKDQVMVLDDFAPTGSSYDVQRWHKKADRVLRAKGNASARQRMRADTTLRPDKPPRALMLSTGEDIPHGQSLRARMMILELSRGELDFGKLSLCQRQAASGAYARAMAAFVQWLAPRYEEVRSHRRYEHAELRESAGTSNMHRRTPGIVADLALGLRHFLIFAHEAGALTEDQAQRTWAQGWQALGESAEAQTSHQAAGEPTRRFRRLLSAAVSSKRAHVADPAGSEPATPGAWGWSENGEGESYRSQGERIGWIDGEDLYLEPEAAYAAAQKQGQGSGEPLTVTGRTLRKRLAERGLLASTDERRGTSTVRRTLEGSRKDVLHTPKNFLSIHTDQTDQIDHAAKEAHTYGDYVPPLWSVPGSETDQRTDHGQFETDHDARTDQRTDQQKAHTYAENPGNGQFGQFLQGEGEHNGNGVCGARRVKGRI